MNIQVFSKTGSVRLHNEDSYAYDKEKKIFVIADGMGGHKKGEIASSMAVKTVMQELTSKDPKEIIEAIEESMLTANQAVYAHAITHPDHKGMGTTLTVVHFVANKLYWGHVGDSRIYLFHDDKLTQLTKDHTMVEELVEIGTISSEQAKNHPIKNVLVKALGTQKEVEVDTGCAEVAMGNIIVMMTDGVYEYIEEDMMAALLKEEPLLQVEKRIDEIICEGGAKDNYTLLMVGLN